MYRSDKIYLSKFALDPDPEYLDLDDFDLDCGEDGDEIYEKITPRNGKKFVKEVRRCRSNENKKSKQPAMPDMDEDLY